MRPLRPSILALVISLAIAGTACGGTSGDAQRAVADASQTISDATAEGGAMAEAFAEAREKLRTENLPLGHRDGLPKAELSPQGDLLIEGNAVPLTEAQREAALAYRNEVLAVAEAGMVMGEKGADIAGDALALAARGLFGGDTSEAEKAIEAKGKAMEDDAQRLCDRIGGLEAAQERLAALVPEFKPYADAQRIDAECDFDHAGDGNDAPAAEVEPAADTVST